MIKVIYLYHKKPGLSVEDFQTYWRLTHGELVGRIPEVRRYVQCQTLLSGYRRPTPPPLDGVEEIYFDEVSDLAFLEATQAGQNAIADLDNFVDTDRVQRIVAEAIVIKEGPIHDGMVKNIEFPTRKPGMPINDFHRYWREVHGPLAAKIEVMKRYVQSHTLMMEYEKEDPPACDGIAETWFDDTAAMKESALTPEYTEVRDDEENFISKNIFFIITREVKFI